METFSSRAALEARIYAFERETKSNFVSASKAKNFGAEDWRKTDRARKRALFWKIPCIPFDGVPFLTLGRKLLGCHQGKSKTKSKIAPGSIQSTKRNTKKLGCPAQIQIHHVIKFPDYQVEKKTTVRKQSEQMKKLRKDLLTDPSLKAETVFYVKLPALSDHSVHPTDGVAAGRREKMDPLVKQEIIRLTRDGVPTVSEMRRHINTFIKNVFGEEEVSDTSRRRYHPLDRDIRSVMLRAKALMHQGKENHENLGCLLKEWQHKEYKTPFGCHPHIKGEGDNAANTSKLDTVTKSTDEGMAVLGESPAASDFEEIYVNLPPQGGSRKHDLHQKCVGLLKQMIESVHQLKDTKYLEELYSDLHCKLMEVQLRTPYEVVIQVGSPQKRKATGGEEGGIVPKKERKT